MWNFRRQPRTYRRLRHDMMCDATTIFYVWAFGWFVGSLPSLLYLFLSKEYLRGQIEGWLLRRAVKRNPPSKDVKWDIDDFTS